MNNMYSKKPLLFAVFVAVFLLSLAISLQIARHDADKAMPYLFHLVQESPSDARQSFSSSEGNDLRSIGSSGDVTISNSNPVEIRIGKDNDYACSATINYLKENPDLLKTTKVSINGLELKNMDVVDDFSCSGKYAEFTVRVSAK